MAERVVSVLYGCDFKSWSGVMRGGRVDSKRKVSQQSSLGKPGVRQGRSVGLD